MDTAQKLAFDYNSKSFLVWDETLTPQYVLTFVSAGYTSAVAGDIGKTVVGGTSAAEGVLISYDNTLRTWNITTSNDINFEDDEAVTITTGTGTGTMEDEDSFVGFKGPYDYPTDPPVRKMWGVTAETDLRIFGTDDTTAWPMQDFDFLPRLYDPRRLFKPGREDDLNQDFTFIDAPELPELEAEYRWVYWRDAADLDDLEDDTLLLIPARYHMNYVNACIKLAQITLSGEDVDPKVIEAFFTPWWNSLARPYTPMGNGSNQTINPRGKSDIHI